MKKMQKNQEKYRNGKGDKLLKDLIKLIKTDRVKGQSLDSVAYRLFERFKKDNPVLEKQLMHPGEVRSELLKDMSEWIVLMIADSMDLQMKLPFSQLLDFYYKRYNSYFSFMDSTGIKDHEMPLIKILEAAKKL